MKDCGLEIDQPPLELGVVGDRERALQPEPDDEMRQVGFSAKPLLEISERGAVANALRARDPAMGAGGDRRD
jgi:hypothetical protein